MATDEEHAAVVAGCVGGTSMNACPDPDPNPIKSAFG